MEGEKRESRKLQKSEVSVRETNKRWKKLREWESSLRGKKIVENKSVE